MFVFVILFYHIKIQKSIVRCTRSCTPDIFLIEIFIFFCRKKIKRQERRFLPLNVEVNYTIKCNTLQKNDSSYKSTGNERL